MSGKPIQEDMDKNNAAHFDKARMNCASHWDECWATNIDLTEYHYYRGLYRLLAIIEHTVLKFFFPYEEAEKLFKLKVLNRWWPRQGRMISQIAKEMDVAFILALLPPKDKPMDRMWVTDVLSQERPRKWEIWSWPDDYVAWLKVLRERDRLKVDAMLKPPQYPCNSCVHYRFRGLEKWCFKRQISLDPPDSPWSVGCEQFVDRYAKELPTLKQKGAQDDNQTR